MIMEKSVAKENEQRLQKPEPQEVDSIVQTPRRNDEAVGNRLSVSLQILKNWRKRFNSRKLVNLRDF